MVLLHQLCADILQYLFCFQLLAKPFPDPPHQFCLESFHHEGAHIHNAQLVGIKGNEIICRLIFFLHT